MKVTAEDSFKVKKEDDPEATWIPTIPGDGNSNETGTFRVLDSQNGVLDSQYEKAMNAMIHNLKARSPPPQACNICGLRGTARS